MIVALTGTGPPFPRLVNALAEYARAEPDEHVWVQHGTTRLQKPLQGAAFVPRQQLLARLREADVVVTHAGSGSIGDALSFGHLPVVVPRRKALNEIVNDHQVELSEVLEEEGRVIVVHDTGALPSAIRAAASCPRLRGTERGVALKRAVSMEAERLAQLPQGAWRRVAVWRVLRAATALMRVRRLGGSGPASDL